MPKQNDLQSPVTYSQKFYAKAAGMDVDLPEAITPEQKYLQAIAERGESIGNIGDVEIDNPENGEVMKYDAEQGKWINGTASGGGGTSDYTDLTNKPKINNVTLAGNKSLSDIGAAVADETYTDAEVDALLSEKADADDVYTKAQMNTELAKKVDKVTGKGLSTNDFTDAYKAAVDGAAPQSTTYTKDEVDAALAAKINASDVDASLSDTSTNPVQNKAIQAPLARLIDAGAKNPLKITATSRTINGVTFSVNDDGTITANGTATADANLFVNTDIPASMLRSGKFIGCPAGGSSSTYQMMLEQGSNPYSLIASDRGSGYDLSYTGNINADCYIQIKSGVTVNNLVFKPMICTTEDWAVSHKFVPYAMSNPELTKKVTEFGVKLITVNLSERTFTKSAIGLYYSDKVDLSGSFSELYAATFQTFTGVGNISIQPMLQNSTMGLYLTVCDPSSPSTLSFTSGSVGFMIFGRLK